MSEVPLYPTAKAFLFRWGRAPWRSCSGRTVQFFRGGLEFKAHRLLYHSTLGSRVIKKKKKKRRSGDKTLSCVKSPIPP